MIAILHSIRIDCSTQCSFDTKDMCDTFVQTMLEMSNFNFDNSVEKEHNVPKTSLNGRMNDVSESAPKWIRPKRQVEMAYEVQYLP